MKKLFSLLFVLWASVSGAQIVNTEGSFIAAGGTLSGCSIYSFVYVDVNGNLACALTPVNGSVSTAGRSILTIRDTITGASATSNFLNITGTFPASISTNNSGVYISTTNGGDAGNSDEYGLFSTIGGASGASGKYHVGTFGQSTSTSSGFAVGAAGEAFFNSSSEYALGVYGGATSINGNTGINVGSVSFAGSNGAAPTAILGSWGEVGTTGTSRIGGFFRLGATGYSTSLGGVSIISTPPTGVAALVADNGAQAANIFEARDNGTAVLTVADGGTITGTQPYNIGNGTAGAPAFAWSADADGTGTGFYRRAANRVTISTNGTGGPEFDAGNMYITNAATLVWLAGAVGTGAGTTLSQESSATLQLGADANGAAVNQTLKAHDGITGTDIAGANLTLAAGRGTGAGTAGNLRIQTAVPVTTGTTAQILADRELFVGKPRSVNDNTATTLFTITLGDDTDGGGIVDFCSMATSATTDRQKTCGQIAFSGVDVTAGAGGETCAAAITGTNSTSVSVGTLTVTAAATTGTDLCNIQITSDSSLNVAHLIRYSVRLHPSASTVVITPQ